MASKSADAETGPAPSVPLNVIVNSALPLASVSAVPLAGEISPTLVVSETSSPGKGVITPSKVEVKVAVIVAGQRCDRDVTASPVLFVAAKLNAITGVATSSTIDCTLN